MRTIAWRRGGGFALTLTSSLALTLCAPTLVGAAEKAEKARKSVNAAVAGIPDPLPLRQPQVIEVGDEPTMLFVQFTDVTVPQENADGSITETRIWTRAYGLEPDTDLIPGPTFRFQPGDFLQLTLNNLLDDKDNPALAGFDNAVDPVFDTDEVAHHVAGEINIPHNPNNTNLHTHGLHVDPDHDDVTLIVLPKGDSKFNYDPSLWPYIREQIWPYQYRIPGIHLPGTHWYHAHKHGSTSIHVENGMAGAFVITPPEGMEDMVPGLPAADDLVMVVQEIANFGLQQGQARSITHLHDVGDLSPGSGFVDADDDSLGADIAPGDVDPTPTGTASTLITVNGQVQPRLTLAPDQVQRWRLVNAAANHRSFSYFWLGRLVETKTTRRRITSGTQKGKKVEVTELVYEQVPLYVAAVDGITLKATVATTAEEPLFLGPGNRADVLVQPSEPGSYALYKNYPPSTFDATATSTAPQTLVVVLGADGKPVTPAAQADQINNPYLLRESESTEANFDGLKVPWVYLDTVKGTPKTVNPSVVVVPLLSLDETKSGGGEFLDLTFPVDFSGVGWQPVDAADAGGGGTDTQLLLQVQVAGQPADGPGLPSAAHLASISPTGTMKPPAYVSPIDDDDVLQSRTALFDLSGVSVIVRPKDDPTKGQSIRQFTLNGRQFDLDDSIGDPDAVEFINDAPNVPGMASEGSQRMTLNCIEHHGLWINQHWVNPGYYRSLEQIEVGGVQGYTYAGDEVVAPAGSQTCVPQGDAPALTYADVTGLDQVAVVNTGHRGHQRIDRIPGLPVATTAEEWVLVNNSPVGHPFHIHINPFFITEIGQLSYEGFKGSKECGDKKAGADDAMAWVIRTVGTEAGEPEQDACAMEAPSGPTKLRGTSTMWWMVDNWWDTIVIPPHGYVRMRYWMNVPQQTGDGSQVFDDVNRAGDWVYHCHILRHEDRGMMMLVGTQPKQEKPRGEEEDGY